MTTWWRHAWRESPWAPLSGFLGLLALGCWGASLSQAAYCLAWASGIAAVLTILTVRLPKEPI